MKLISGSMAVLISKICVIGQQQTQMCFMDENDRHVTVNGELYRAMLEDYLWPELD